MRYKSFILRVWLRHDLNGAEWAGRLQSIQAPGEWRFHTLEQLLMQLRLLADADTLQEAVDCTSVARGSHGRDADEP